MKYFNYTDNFIISEPSDTYFIDLNEAMSRDEFDDFYYNIFNKGELGRIHKKVNWDAFSELLLDDSFTSKRSVVINHTNLPLLDDKQLGIYLCLLLEAVNTHDIFNEARKVKVIFSEDLKNKVESVIDKEGILYEVKRRMSEYHKRKAEMDRQESEE